MKLSPLLATEGDRHTLDISNASVYGSFCAPGTLILAGHIARNL
ncbi:hypothetical protein ABZ628_24370 [Streptomyces diastaticus]